MQNEYSIQQPGTTAEEWEGGAIPGHSPSGMVARKQRNVTPAPESELPPRFSIELTPDELWRLGECAYEQGLTMPQLVRQLILEELALRSLG